MYRKINKALGVVGGLALSAITQASPITFDATDTGWYLLDGTHNTNNPNYIVSEEHNNFSVFDLSSLADTITSATLRLFNPHNGYATNDPLEVFQIFDVMTPIDSLLNGTGGQKTYFDLEGGSLFGSTYVTSQDNGNYVEVEINQLGIDYLNQNTLVAFGGSLTTADDHVDRLFGYTHSSFNPNFAQLQVSTTLKGQVPEPGTLALLGCAVFLGFSTRKRKAG